MFRVWDTLMSTSKAHRPNLLPNTGDYANIVERLDQKKMGDISSWYLHKVRQRYTAIKYICKKACLKSVSKQMNIQSLFAL